MKKLARRIIGLLGLGKKKKGGKHFWPQVIKSACNADYAPERIRLRNSIIINPDGTVTMYDAKGDSLTWRG